MAAAEVIGFFIAGVVFASFLEYWVHRYMHATRGGLGAKHRDHHAENAGQGVLKEFWDYLKGAWLVFPLMFPVSVPAGVGWFLGTLSYTFFIAYAHQLQHEDPTKCFWMRMPVHYVHHRYNTWRYNYGLAVDWWDHVFRTYKPVEWKADVEPVSVRSCWRIRWW